MAPARFIRMLVSACVLPAAMCAPAAAAATGIADAVRDLAARHGFEVRGIERLDDAPAPQAGEGTALVRLRALLGNYNHVVEGTPEQVRRVIILGRKSERPPLQVVRTRRRGGHHLVDAAVQGPSAKPLTLSLMLDTGASTVVLPSSLIPALGFEEHDLRERNSQTVNGQVSGRAGTLAEVRVGGSVVRDVEVLFVEDARLGGVKLLGMSYLGHFAFTVDDAASQLVLTPR